MVTWKNPCYLNLPLWLFMCNSIILLYIITAEMIINSAHNDNHNAIRNSYQTTRTGNNTIFLILFFVCFPDELLYLAHFSNGSKTTNVLVSGLH